MGHPYDVEHASQMHVDWCHCLIERTGLTTTHQTGPQMRAVMLELRRSIDPAAVIAIANVLPALERGIFLEDWSLGYLPDPPQNPDEFYRRVYERVKGHHAPPETIAADIFWLWNEKLPPAKSAVIRAHLPATLGELWPA